MKKLLAILLTALIIFTGCGTNDTVSENSSVTNENLLSDEQALEIANRLIEKAEKFNSFMYEVLEFGEYKLDELDVFEDYNFKYAEFHIENMLEYLDSEIFYERFPKDEFNFSSRQDIYDYIETFAHSAEEAGYAVELAFEDRDGRFYYNTFEISAVGMFSVTDIKVVKKFENEIVFSGNSTDNNNTPTEFSIVKNDQGEWRLNRDFFRDQETYENNENYKQENERYVKAVVATAAAREDEIEFESQHELSFDQIFHIWHLFVFDGTYIGRFDELYFSEQEEYYFYAEKVESFARQYFKLTAEEMRKSPYYDATLCGYRLAIYETQKYYVNFTKIEEHGIQTHYYFEYTSPYIIETKTGLFVMDRIQSLRFD